MGHLRKSGSAPHIPSCVKLFSILNNKIASFHTIYHSRRFLCFPSESRSQYQRDSLFCFSAALLEVIEWLRATARETECTLQNSAVGRRWYLAPGRLIARQHSGVLLLLSSLFLQWKVLFLYIWWRVSSPRGHYGGGCAQLWSNAVARNYRKHYSQCSSHSDADIRRACFRERRQMKGQRETLKTLTPALLLVHYL